MLDGELFAAPNYNETYSSVQMLPDHNPCAEGVFEIPNGIRSPMERMFDTEEMLFSYKDSLASLLRSTLYNGVEDL